MMKSFAILSCIIFVLTFYMRNKSSYSETKSLSTSPEIEIKRPLGITTDKKDRSTKHISKKISPSNLDTPLYQKKYQEEIRKIVQKIRQYEIKSSDDFVDFADAYNDFYKELTIYLTKKYSKKTAYKKAYEYVKFKDNLDNKIQPLFDKYFEATDKMLALSSEQNRDVHAYKKSRDLYKRLDKAVKKAQVERDQAIQSFWGTDYQNIVKILDKVNYEFNERNSSYISYNVGISL